MKNGSNIRLRSDGRYESRYIKSRTADGKAIWGYCYGKTYEEAEQKRNLMCTPHLREMNLLILGCGEHGREVLELAKELMIFKEISFLDDDDSKANVIGKCSELNKFKDKFPIAIPAIGDNIIRKKWAFELSKEGFIIPTFIHPNASVSQKATVGSGTVIYAGATIGYGAEVGDGCIIDSGAVVERHSKVPDWTLVNCGVIFHENSDERIEAQK